MIFAKGHGTQNDFVLLPDVDAELVLTAARVAALCDRRKGLGADGVLRVTTAGAAQAVGVLDSLPEGVRVTDWYMDYRNADGSAAQMCGNGVRVFAHYLRASGLEVRDEFVVGSLAGPRPVTCHHVEAAYADVSVDMGKANRLGAGEAVVGGRRFHGLAVDVGNPHLACVDSQLTVDGLAALDVGAPVISMVRSSPTGSMSRYSPRRSTGRSGCGFTNAAWGKPARVAPGRLRPRSPRWRRWARRPERSPCTCRAERSWLPSPMPPASCVGRQCWWPAEISLTIGGTRWGDPRQRLMPANSDARPAATCHHRVLAMTYPDPPQTGLSDFTPSLGELALEDRSALRRVAGLSTELADVSEVEYRQLRLERVVLVGVWTEGSAADNRASLAELAALAETAGSQVLEGLIQRRDKPDPSTYIGSGKAAELREVIVATGADTVICDGELSPAQLTALEKAVQVKVIDRTALILDIFAQHATSREGKAQVSLAQMEYMLPRLRGWGESMSRQAGGRAGGSGGGVGLRGPGETKIETDRRRIRERMAKLRRDIRAMKQVRDTQRSRRRHSDVPSIAIVGYTNAGKSSLLNALTGAGVLVQDALFATLEPTTRRAEFGDGRPVVLTDTVGFVRHLPTQLVEAFRSTLEEVVHADLLVHVVDGSDGHPLAQIDAVRQVISEVIADHDGDPPPELLVVNKVDVASDLMLAKLRHGLPGAVFVSARTGDGIDALRRRMAELVVPADTAVDVVIPYDRGDLVARVHADGRIQQAEHKPEGTRIKARVPEALAATLREFAPRA